MSWDSGRKLRILIILFILLISLSIGTLLWAVTSLPNMHAKQYQLFLWGDY